MATVASMAIGITATTQAFSAGIDAASLKVQAFASGVVGLGASLARVGAGAVGLGAIASGGVAAGLLAMTKQGFDAVASTSKLASKLDISTESMGAFQLATRLAGGDTEAMELGLKKAQIKLGELQAANGETIATFLKLGLSARDLVGIPLDQFIGKIGDRLSKLPTNAQKAAASFEIFGKQGAGLGPILKGTQELNDKLALQKSLGQNVSPIDAKQVELANRSLKLMHELFSGIGVQIAVGVAPFVSALANKIIETGTIGTTFGSTVTAALETVAGGVAFALDMWTNFKSVIAIGGLTIVAGLQAVADGFVALAQTVLELGAKLPERFGGNMFAGALDSVTEFRKGLTGAMEATGADLNHVLEDFGKNGAQAGVKEFFDGIRAKAQQSAQLALQIKHGDNGLNFTPKAKFHEDKGPAALDRGSKEALSAVAAFERGGSNNPAIKTNEILAEQRAIQKRMADNTEKLIDAVKNQVIGVATF